MKLFDIDVSFHWSWWILFGFVVAPNIITLNLIGFIVASIVMAFLAGLIIMHELAHALTARKYGYRTSYIMMHLAGGVAMVDMSRATPKEIFWIAAAGPASNITLGVIGLIPMLILPEIQIVSEVLSAFVAINFLIGIFNLIPAYPMDGGRMLRATLHKNKALATQVSHVLSISFGSLFILTGLYLSGPVLMIVGAILIYLVLVERRSGTTI